VLFVRYEFAKLGLNLEKSKVIQPALLRLSELPFPSPEASPQAASPPSYSPTSHTLLLEEQSGPLGRRNMSR